MRGQLARRVRRCGSGKQTVREGGTAPRLDPTCTCWKPAAWWCGWSTPATPEHLPGRPKTDRLDAVWLARLNERGRLRPSFVPPAQIRRLRDSTRLRPDLTAERGRQGSGWSRLLEDAQIKLGTVATDIMGVSGRAMLEALIAGQRDPKVLAELARGRMRGKRGALVQALTGRFDDHHAELARMLLDHYDALTGQIDRLTVRIQELIGAIPAAQAPGNGAGPTGGRDGGTSGVGAHPQAAQPPLGALERLDEVPGIGAKAAQVIIAEVGLDMGQFPTPGHLVSWARLAPRTIQSGATHRAGTTGKGNPYLKGVLGEVAAAAAKTDTFLGQRYRRLVRRIGKLKALVAIARPGPGDRLAPAGRPYRPLPRPRRRLLHQPHRQGPQDPQPPPPTPGAGLQRHLNPGRLTHAVPHTPPSCPLAGVDTRLPWQGSHFPIRRRVAPRGVPPGTRCRPGRGDGDHPRCGGRQACPPWPNA